MGLLSKSKKERAAGDEDPSRSALFGSRKGKASPAPKDNPYATPAANDQYANPPPPYTGGNNSFRQDKSPAVTGPGQDYGGRQGPGGGGYGAQGGSYSAGGGYGGDRYGSGGGAPARQGGYGGMGPADDDAGRDQLFGGARERVQRQPPQQAPQSGAYGGESGAYGAPGSGYGTGPAYGDRELTAEEQEEEDINATKSEIKFMKQQDVSSTRNALRLAQQAEETGRDTLARLGAQGERIHNTERNLDLASSQNRIAEEKAREIKTLNRSMFAVHVSNPFTSSSRAAERDAKLLETHRSEREQRDATRKAAWESGARKDEAFRANAATGASGGKSTLADRAKFQFEADSDDDDMENEIDGNLDALHGAAKRLNHLGPSNGPGKLTPRNKHIDRIITKTDKGRRSDAMNRARLDRIH